MTALAGHHAVVTGGGRGIGRAIAARAVARRRGGDRHGAHRGSLIDAVDRGDASAYVVADVTDPNSVGAAMKSAEQECGPISILVANAGRRRERAVRQIEPRLFRQMFEINTIGAVHATQAVLGGMVARGFGRMVAIASTAGLKGYGYVSAYCAAKHAVVGLVRALAAETVKTGVTVNAVCPGYTDTDLVDQSLAAHHADDRALARGRPCRHAQGQRRMGRLITPDEVAAAVVFLCMPEAAAITGTALPIAGGEI